MAKPSLDLAVEVTTANGATYRWGPESNAGSVPQNLGFRTKQGDGFADGAVNLSRRVDRDYVDLNLYDQIVLSGSDGSVAYEGYVQAVPRSLNQTHSVTVQTVGWMTHTRDRKMSEIYVDRDLSRWQSRPAITRQATLGTGNYKLFDGSVGSDATRTAIVMPITDSWPSPTLPIVELLYDAGPNNRIGAIYYSFQNQAKASLADTAWRLYVGTASDPTYATQLVTGNLWGNPLPAGSYFTPATGYRYGFSQYYYSTTAGGAAGVDYSINAQFAVYGDHSLTRQGTDPGGIYASDAIRHLVTKYCPLLNTSGVQNTTFAIPHLAFVDRVDPYDALLEINKYHLWQLAVYENRTLYYFPIDLTEYDWEVRLSDPGVTIDWQGDSTSSLANGIVVTYTDVATGATNVITPDDDATLKDTTPDNPANLHGRTDWTEITLSTPTTATAAAQLGRAALASYNQPKAPGTISVQGHIRDRQGHWQPVWKVRSSDRIAITDHPNDRPRLVVSTDYQHPTRTIQIAVDAPFRKLDAVLDRLQTAVAAANLSQPA